MHRGQREQAAQPAGEVGKDSIALSALGHTEGTQCWFKPKINRGGHFSGHCIFRKYYSLFCSLMMCFWLYLFTLVNLFFLNESLQVSQIKG